MKKLAVVIVMVLSLMSCKEDDSNKVPVSVALHSQFEDDDVVVKIDGRALIDGVATTQHTLGVCFVDGKISSLTDVTKGTHQILVQVNQTVVETASFTATKDVYIGVSFDPSTSGIAFVFSDEPFMYD